MTNQIRAEMLKIRSTRTTAGLVAGMLALVTIVGLLSGLLQDPGDLRSAEDQRTQLGVGSLASLFSALAGVLLITSEIRFGTIRPTFLVSPRWRGIIGAKLVASCLTGLVFGVVGMLLAFPIGYACLSARGIPYSLGGGDLAWLMAGTIAGTAVWGAIGVGLGAVVRNQVGAIITLLVWGFVVENLLWGIAPSVGRFVPGEAQSAFQGEREAHMLAPAAGGLVMLAWLAVLVAAGYLSATRHDVA